MINRQALLADLQKFLQGIEADLLERSESTEVPEVPAALHAEYEKAAKAERTAQNYEDWRTDTITQAAAAWVLSCVFVRFLEDNSLIDPPKIAGPGERLARARDEHELYFRSHPQHTDREYLLSIFAELAKLPGTKDIFGEHNAINDLPNWLSGDAAGELLNFFQKIDASTGDLVHDFTDPTWDTRFLGDLYQDLSEAARKKFALLQTPEFVEEFILDRTLDPAIEEFGLTPQPFGSEGTAATRFNMIDPACGSGHFLLGAFPRLLDRWLRKEPGINIRELTQRALDSIHGVDINPFAVAIAKFRLLLAAMKACEEKKLHKGLPPFQIHIACGDSLLHGENRTSSGQKLWDYAEGATDQELYSHAYPGEDLQTVRALLRAGNYHCVVANPPYIVPRDSKLNGWYRKRFTACHRQYSLSVPFIQLIQSLATLGGFTGQITSNSFMKREFGKKIVESVFPTFDLTHVIDTAGAYIPGHGTPTVILFARQRSPQTQYVRMLLGKQGEPATPDDPSNGMVWTSIVKSIDSPETENDYISCSEMARNRLGVHPWSIGGGGAAELKDLLDDASELKLEELSLEIGAGAVTREDDVYLIGKGPALRHRIHSNNLRPLIEGDGIRNWMIVDPELSIWPYEEQALKCIETIAISRYLWLWKTQLSKRIAFGISQIERDLNWFEFSMFFRTRYRSDRAIGFAAVATHNHFVKSRTGDIFKDSAPAIIVKPEVKCELIDSILGILNSSSVCFWMKQVCQNKGSTVDQHGARQRTAPFEDFYQFNGTKLSKAPLFSSDTETIARLANSILARVDQVNCLSTSTISLYLLDDKGLRDGMEKVRAAREQALKEMIFLQEELDWACYQRFQLIDEGDSAVDCDLLPICVGERAFEISLARKITTGEQSSTWFDRHNAKPKADLPSHWPSRYSSTVCRRLEIIENNANIRLIEQPEFKRRWNIESWEAFLNRKLQDWLHSRIESYCDYDLRMSTMTIEPNEHVSRSIPLDEVAMYSVAQLADAARRDPQFMEVGELYRDDPAFDVQALVEELVLAESVPHLPILRYKDSGLRKRAEWEKTWDLQRLEDDIDAELKSAQESLKLAEQGVRERFKSELEELGKMRARLLEATTHAYIDLGKEVPSYDPQYEAEIHAGVLLNQIGLNNMSSAMALNSAKDAVFKYQLDLDHKIRLACDEDITVLKCHSRLRAIPDKPDISVPPKYTSADFISTGGARYWALRGKLDVPKERWISFPHCEGPDGTLVICWAGYDHLQQAQAISAYYVRVQTEFGGSDDPRLIPLLASLIELLPWLKQWHNEPNANFDGLRMGDYFEGFVNEEARNLGKTLAEIKAWTQPVRTATRSRKKAK